MNYLIYCFLIIILQTFAQTTDDEFIYEDIDAQPVEVVYTPVVPPNVQSIGFQVNVPLFGTLNFTKATPPKTGFESKIPQLAQPIVLGPVRIDAGVFSFGNGKLSYLAQGSLFGKKISLGLKEFGTSQDTAGNAITTIQLGITFEELLSLEIAPGNNVAVDAADIIVSKSKDPILRIQITLFEKPIILEMVLGQTGLQFKASLKDAVTYAGLTIKDAEIIFDTDKRNLLLKGVAAVRDNPLLKSLSTLLKTPLNFSVPVFVSIPARGAPAVVNISLQTERPIQPFAALNIPNISNISLHDIEVEIVEFQGSTEFKIKGTTELFDLLLKTTLTIKPEGGSETFIMRTELPESFKLSQVISALNKSTLDSLKLVSMQVIITNKDFIDPQTKIALKPGINVFGNIYLQGILQPVATLTKLPEDVSFPFNFIVPLDPRDTVIRISLDKAQALQVSNTVALKQFSVEIAGFPEVFVSLLSILEIKFKQQDSPLIFTTRIKMGAANALVAGTLLGNWQNPFGIKGIMVRDVAVQAGVDYKLLISTGIPLSTLGIAGFINFSKYEIKVVGSGSITEQDKFILSGELNQLYLADLVDVASKIIKKNIPTDTLPQLGFEDVKVYIAPEKVTIGELSFDKGLSLAGTLILPFTQARSSLTLQEDGWIGYGYATTIKWGALTITGTGPDKIENTPDDGPSVSLRLTTNNPEVYLDGIVTIDQLFKFATRVHLAPNHFLFSGTTELQNIFKVFVEGKASWRDKELYLLIDLLNDFNNFVIDNVVEQIDNFEKKSLLDLDKTQKKINEFNQQIKDLNIKIEKKHDALKALVGQKNATTLNTFRNKVAKLQAKWDRLSTWQRTLHSADIGVPLVAERTALEVAEKALKSAKAAQLSSELLALKIKKESLRLALNVVVQTLEGVKFATKGIASGGKFFVKTLFGTIILNKARVAGNAKDLIKGELPSLTLEFTAFGKNHAMNNVAFDLKNPKKSARLIAQQIADFIIGEKTITEVVEEGTFA